MELRRPVPETLPIKGYFSFDATRADVTAELPGPRSRANADDHGDYLPDEDAANPLPEPVVPTAPATNVVPLHRNS